jgi:hypothetical protein
MPSENLDVQARVNQVTVEDVRISAAGGDLSLLGQVVSLDIFENIFSPFLTGNMILSDGVGMMKNFPITGREIVTIRYKTPLDTGDVKEAKLQIVSQISRTRTDNRNDVVQLRLLSPFGFSDLNQTVSKSYSGTHSEIVSAIVNDYYGTSVDADATQGDSKYAFTFKKPSEQIQRLASTSFAISKDNKSSGYVFYETASGFKFKNLQKLFDTSPNEDFYYVDAKVNRANFEMDEFTFQNHIMRDIVLPRAFNRPTQLTSGGFGGIQYTVDPTQKSWNAKQISYLDSPAAELDTKHPIVAGSSRLNNTAAKIYLLNRQSKNIDNSENTLSDLAETNAYSQMNYNTHNDTTINFTVSGDSRLEAGKTVSITLQKNEPDLSITESEFDDEKSGLYLIKSLHHKFYFPNDQKIELKTALQCVRNFRGQPVPDTVNTGDLTNG